MSARQERLVDMVGLDRIGDARAAAQSAVALAERVATSDAPLVAKGVLAYEAGLALASYRTVLDEARS